MDKDFGLKKFAALEPKKNGAYVAETDKKYAEIKDQTKKDISDCTTKIMNTTSFRKLAGKTQVILSLSGPDVRTRLTHTIEVAKIAKDICIRLGLNAELAEAIALAHDIGHTPFGHVGERTLREIMCGCDTLGNKISGVDFINSGFKHNLQSFRVLNDIERVSKNGNHSEIWPYIFWGAPAHTSLTWAKDGSGMDNEILISPKYCDWVYVCHHDDRKKCKRNIQIKKDKDESNEDDICKPWYCANLPIIKKENEVLKKHLYNGETRREHLKRKPIIKKLSNSYIYCSHKCYLANLWKHKIDKKDMYKTYPYFFDHPFPNSFYIDSFHKYFTDNPDFISLEALIVGQADEIAQRQQDLEDGILKKLLPFEQAKDNVKELVDKVLKGNNNEKLKKIIEKIVGTEELIGLDGKYTPKQLFEYITTPEELGKFLTVFYINVIVDQTQTNINKWATNGDEISINIYSLMNILYTMIDDNDKKIEWLITELKSCKKNEKISIPKNNWINTYFNVNTKNSDSEKAYLYLLSFDFLEQLTKQFDFEQPEQRVSMVTILSKCIDCINKNTKAKASEEVNELQKLLIERFKKIDPLDKNHKNFAFRFINALDSLSDFLRKKYKKESNDFFNMENVYWKTIGWLDLYSFYPILKIYDQIKNGKEFNSIVDLKDFAIEEDDHRLKNEVKSIFERWKKILKADANKVLGNLVVFYEKEDKDRKNAFKKFEKEQRDTILKSEAVEKNDGKANFILKKLFKAYIDNSHQLSDTGLKYLLRSINDKSKLEALIKDEKETFKTILEEIEETILSDDKKIDEILKINFLTFIGKEEKGSEKTKKNIQIKKKNIEKEQKFEKLKEEFSSEVMSSLDKRKDLYKYFKEIKSDKTIERKLNSEDKKGKEDIQTALRRLRANLNNPILNAIPFWQSILTRGICDYIASLTDQEAVNEYEKLYSGLMEIF